MGENKARNWIFYQVEQLYFCSIVTVKNNTKKTMNCYILSSRHDGGNLNKWIEKQISFQLTWQSLLLFFFCSCHCYRVRYQNFSWAPEFWQFFCSPSQKTHKFKVAIPNGCDFFKKTIAKIQTSRPTRADQIHTNQNGLYLRGTSWRNATLFLRVAWGRTRTTASIDPLNTGFCFRNGEFGWKHAKIVIKRSISFYPTNTGESAVTLPDRQRTGMTFDDRRLAHSNLLWCRLFLILPLNFTKYYK